MVAIAATLALSSLLLTGSRIVLLPYLKTFKSSTVWTAERFPTCTELSAQKAADILAPYPAVPRP